MKKILIGFAIILLAFFFRFNNLNWDSSFHLHPDERFLTMVGQAMEIPSSINQYFDQKTSLLNPANIRYNFFVYGQLPLILTKYLAVNSNLDNYNDFTILGRQLSAFFDLLVIILVYKTAKLLIGKYREVNFNKFQQISTIPFWAAFFYAIAVLPIQLSHFFAVDTFLNFFMFGSFYFALRYSMMDGKTPPLRYLIFSAVFFGLALACKVTALFILPLNLFFLIKTVFVRRQSLIKTTLFVILYGLTIYFTLRFADPYLFQNPNFFNPTLNTQFVENLKQLKSFESKDIWYPPAVQWINKPKILFSLINLAVFGVGIPYFVLIIIGIILIISNIKNQISKMHFKNQKNKNHLTKKQYNNFDIFIILLWTLIFFLYQSTQFTKAMRYFIFIYPFLAILAGIGINVILNGTKNLDKKIFVICNLLFIIFLIIWPLMFSSIYFHQHTRVEASEWIYKNLPSNSIILGEYWDDPLPLSIINNYGKQFVVGQLPVFDQDTPEKWQKMNEILTKANYYILSSNRGWGSILTVPEKYPQMSWFYKQLLSDKLSYKKIKEFKPYYYKFFQLPNSWVDESFTVYDQPTVIVLKKSF